MEPAGGRPLSSSSRSFSRLALLLRLAMASESPPPPPDPHRFRPSPCCGSSSSSSSPPRPSLRRAKTLANPESPRRWRREPLVDVTNRVLGAEAREHYGRLHVRRPVFAMRAPVLSDAFTFRGRDPTRLGFISGSRWREMDAIRARTRCAWSSRRSMRCGSRAEWALGTWDGGREGRRERRATCSGARSGRGPAVERLAAARVLSIQPRARQCTLSAVSGS